MIDRNRFPFELAGIVHATLGVAVYVYGNEHSEARSRAAREGVGESLDSFEEHGLPSDEPKTVIVDRYLGQWFYNPAGQFDGAVQVKVFGLGVESPLAIQNHIAQSIKSKWEIIDGGHGE